MDSIPNVKPSDIQAFLSVLDHVHDSGLLAKFDIDIEARMQDVKDKIRQVSGEWYEMTLHEKQSAPGVNRALPLLLVTDEIEKSAKALDKRFPEPLLGQVLPQDTECERSLTNESAGSWTLCPCMSRLLFLG